MIYAYACLNKQLHDMQGASAVGAPGKPPGNVRLVAQPGMALTPGRQVTFSYGDKGNEELLMLYGAAPAHAHGAELAPMRKSMLIMEFMLSPRMSQSCLVSTTQRGC